MLYESLLLAAQGYRPDRRKTTNEASLRAAISFLNLCLLLER